MDHEIYIMLAEIVNRTRNIEKSLQDLTEVILQNEMNQEGEPEEEAEEPEKGAEPEKPVKREIKRRE